MLRAKRDLTFLEENEVADPIEIFQSLRNQLNWLEFHVVLIISDFSFLADFILFI